MNRGKRIAAVALSCALVVGASGELKLVPIAAAEGTSVIVGRFARFVWTFEPVSGTLIIDGEGEINMQSTNLPWASFASQIKRVIFRNGVKSIPTGFFDGMTQLQEVIIPATVTEIGENLFAGHANINIYYEGDADIFNAMLRATNQEEVNVSSVTRTVTTDENGNRVETITRPDGSQTVIVSKPDGTLVSTTEVDAKGNYQKVNEGDSRVYLSSNDPDFGYYGYYELY